MARRQKECGSRNTSTGHRCRLPAASCPHRAHKLPDRDANARQRLAAEAAEAAAGMHNAVLPTGLVTSAIRPPDPVLPHLDDDSEADVCFHDPGSGLASQQNRFKQAIDATSATLGLLPSQMAHDYWLVRALSGVASSVGAGSVVERRDKRGNSLPVGRWAFSGGTSLTAAWGIGQRYSVDIDSMLFAEHGELTKNSRRKAARGLTNGALSVLGDAEHTSNGDPVRHVQIGLGEYKEYLKFEVTPKALDSPLVDKIVAPREVMSLVAQFASDISVEEFPEAGGFEVLTVTPAWTAVNKLDALHRRAAEGDLPAIEARGRDLYDLWAISRTEHRDETVAMVPELWEAAATGIRAMQPRPADGYGTSPVFTPGADASEALRRGYLRAVDDVVWGEPPEFEEALEAARNLDIR